MHPTPGIDPTIDALVLDPDHAGRAVHDAEIPARPERTASLRDPLDPAVASGLAARGIDTLWSHQVAAIDHLRSGRHTVVATGTASGKSLCYQIPILDAIAREGTATALALFPTKALARDQLRSLASWGLPGVVPVPYDGDTPPDDRAWARRHANVVLTNPEMLHLGILPAHARWATFLMRLEYVVVDELHALRGIFGGHVAQVLRRLRRLCAHYGSAPTLCFTSATIGNPAALATALAGAPVEAITEDGAPAAGRRFVLWQRPLLDEALGTRRSANSETADLLAAFVRDGHPTLAFTRSRRGAELVADAARRTLEQTAPDLAPRIAAYRAGYRPEERREVEVALSDGRLLGVAATNALELGIDVGGLDAVVLNGFPGTLASLRQQAGRAGRAGRRAAAVLVAGDDQLDQWYVAHPDQLLTRPAESAVINPDNPFVLRPHVACAAHELPLTPEDEQWFGGGLDDAVRELVQVDLLRPRDGRMFWAGRTPPAPSVGLRTGTNEEVSLLTTEGGRTRLVGTVDGSRVYNVAHEGAVYLHQGRQWQVERLEVEDHAAWLVEADDLDEYTQPREDTQIAILETERSADRGAGRAHLGRVEVTNQVVAYQRRRVGSGESLGIVDLDVPPRVLDTRACWYTVPDEALAAAGVDASRTTGAVHAAEHALIGLLPLFAICDRWDVGGVSMAAHPQTGQPTIVVYDGYPGGAGIAELAFADVDRHVRDTLALVEACACDHGCPSCVQSPKCGNWNEHLDKDAAIALLRLLVG
ncbi:MAG: DEAD/DEAH box helicase [Actinomycetes bacterium]